MYILQIRNKKFDCFVYLTILYIKTYVTFRDKSVYWGKSQRLFFFIKTKINHSFYLELPKVNIKCLVCCLL